MSLADRRGPWGARPYGQPIAAPEHTAYLDPSPKRVRVEIAGVTLADSRRPHLLHQPGAPAAWWFPREDVRTELLEEGGSRGRHPLFGPVEVLDLRVGSRREPGFATRHPDVVALRGLLGFDWRRVDRLYEEDELVAPEPIDPYHRIDVRDSSRRLRISLHGVLLAESHAPRVVFETTARPRFYLAAAELRTGLLEPSDLRTSCQYKGTAEYFHVRVGRRLVANLVWRYPAPARMDGASQVATRSITSVATPRSMVVHPRTGGDPATAAGARRSPGRRGLEHRFLEGLGAQVGDPLIVGVRHHLRERPPARIAHAQHGVPGLAVLRHQCRATVAGVEHLAAEARQDVRQLPGVLRIALSTTAPAKPQEIEHHHGSVVLLQEALEIGAARVDGHASPRCRWSEQMCRIRDPFEQRPPATNTTPPPKRRDDMAADTRVHKLPGISCGHCKQAIETEVGAHERVDSAVVDVDQRTVSVADSASGEDVEAAIRKAGYEIAPA